MEMYVFMQSGNPTFIWPPTPTRTFVGAPKRGDVFLELLQVVLTSLLSAVVLFLLTKLMGDKQISQLSMFDYVTRITIGSVAAEMATELEKPFQPLVAMIVYGLLAVLITVISGKCL